MTVLVDALIAARDARAPLVELHPHLPETVEAAYRLQSEHAARLAARSDARRAGWKLGATSPETQKLLGFDAPFWGPILSDAVFESPARLRREDLFVCAVEAEITLRLADDMPARPGGWTPQAAEAAVAGAHVSLEIPDSRLAAAAPMDSRAVIADLGSAGALVLGPEIADWRAMDLAALKGRILDGRGRVLAEGRGAAALGGPLRALAWFADARAAAGDPLRAGDLVATGAFAAPILGRAGTTLIGDFGRAGTVELTLE